MSQSKLINLENNLINLGPKEVLYRKYLDLSKQK